jgi:hypothetical protein
MEGLERFVQGEPLRRLRECFFGVLALESDRVDRGRSFDPLLRSRHFINLLFQCRQLREHA